MPFQHTAARRRLERLPAKSTTMCGFNTQPPEGGWARFRAIPASKSTFQHTAARRRLVFCQRGRCHELCVSTHSRPKAAGAASAFWAARKAVSTHSRPKAAGQPKSGWAACASSFNTQPPEGGWVLTVTDPSGLTLFQHTAARRRLVSLGLMFWRCCWFQHTAARRRLA